MVTSNGLFRIFWPSDALANSNPGVIIGWRNSDHDVVVITILHDVEVKSVENALRTEVLYRNSPYEIALILDRCGNRPLQVLGIVNPQTTPTGSFNPAALVAFTSKQRGFPKLHSPAIDGLTVQILLFDRPNPNTMQYLSLAPIALALGDKTIQQGKSNPPLDKLEAADDRARARKQMLIEKLTQHTVVKHAVTAKDSALNQVVTQINCSHELNALLQSNVRLIGRRQRRALSVGERVVESATTLWILLLRGFWHVAVHWIYPILAQLGILGLMIHRVLAELLLQVLEWRLFAGDSAPKDFSATAQQFDIRLQQFCYWPIQFITLRKRSRNWQSITSSHPEYIRFYNSLWLVANDVIIGIALGSYIVDNADSVASQIDRILDAWTIDALRHTIVWLMDWPAGLKLNTELASFLGDLFLWVIDYWAGCMDLFRPYLPEIIRLIGFSSFAGATMPLSLFSDLASLTTLHIYAFYVASARIYNWQVSIIGSLFQLFRGKKINILRKRIDSCDYDLDQLLLGTILFTLLFFLLPTVFVFYLTFAGARMAIITLKAVLDTMLAFLNHFPLFALMLRFKDFRRLPGGIHFELQSENASQDADSVPTSFIRVCSVPLSFRAMFHEYFQLADRLRQHYVAIGVVGGLVLGRFVPPIHRRNLYSLQYSMLPAQRIPIGALWNMLEHVESKQKGSNGHLKHANGDIPHRSKKSNVK